MTSTSEEWRPVVGYEGWYEVSNHGRIKRIYASQGTYAGRVFHPSISVYGYYITTLSKPDVRVHEAVHRIVARAFIGPIPDGYHVNHIDTNKTNNHVANLEILTPAEHAKHSFTHGLMPLGEKRPGAKLKDKDVIRIRCELIHVMSQKQIARLFGVTDEVINRVVQGKSHRHCAQNQEAVNIILQRHNRERTNHWTRKITTAEVYIIRRLQGRVQAKELAAWFGLHKYSVQSIWRRAKWPHLPEETVA